MASGLETDPRFSHALGEIFEPRRGGVDLGLDRMRACLAALDLKHEPRAVIQVAGTNGKGSTCAFLASVLEESGYRTGVYGSPHLQTVCERIRIGGEPISQARFVEAHGAIQEAFSGLTFFEALTAMAAWCFDRETVDVAIYEVGLGGRLDSTTAIDSTLSIVTGIGLDHAEFLGETLSEIAAEKAGIFRPGVPAIVGLSAAPAVREQLREAADLPVLVSEHDLAGLPELSLRGEHQRRNAACARVAAMELQRAGLAITQEGILRGLQRTSMLGRMTALEPGLWIDGAHNAQAARALAEAIRPLPPAALVVGLSSTKPPVEVLQPLKECARAIVAVDWPSDRAMSGKAVAHAAHSLGFDIVLQASSPGEGVELARRHAETVIVTGSLLMLGAYLNERHPEKADPIAVTDPSHKPGRELRVY